MPDTHPPPDADERPRPSWLPGLELCRALYTEAVRPLLDRALPRLRYAAARVGTGSDVLGYDTERSTDHEWGPRLTLFLTPADRAAHQERLHELFAAELPRTVRGWSTHYVRSPREPHVRTLAPPPATGPVHHLVEVAELGEWLTDTLALDPRQAELTCVDWLGIPAQRLLEVTAGAVFHDGLGELTAVRRRLARYPDQVLRYVLAAQWQRVHEEEPFVGRAAEAGDDTGSRVVAARLARELMRLALLLAGRYPPYSKWLGTAFATLPEAGPLARALRDLLAAPDAEARPRALAQALTAAAELHNATGLTAPLDTSCRPFHRRPYPVLDAQRFAEALRATLRDPVLRRLPPVGSVDQFADSTALLVDPWRARAAARAVLTPER